MKRFRDEGITLNDVGSAQAEVSAVTSGKIATMLTPPATLFFLTSSGKQTKGDWGAVLLPSFGPKGARGTNVGGTSLVITDQTDNPEAAWAFLRYWLLTVKGRITSQKAGLLFENLFKPAAEAPYFHTGEPFYGGQRLMDLWADAAKRAPVFAEGRDLEQVNRAFYSGVIDFFKGSSSPQDFAGAIQNGAR